MVGKTLGIVAAAALTLAGGVASAEEVTGTVKAWNANEKVLTLDNGDKYFFRDNFPMAGIDIKQGDRVKVVFDIDANEQNEKVVRLISPAPEGPPR